MNTVGIIGAMEIEVETLKKHMKIRRTVNKAHMEFCEGVLGGKEVVVVRSGIGKVNAAVCTQILVDDFKADTVINTGIAGSLKAEINIGDIVISTDLVHHDMDAVNFGYPLGQIPQMDTFSFKADEKLAELAEKACHEVNPEIQVFRGRIVSGDQFIADKAVKNRITENFQGYCTEMEGAAIAQATHSIGLPFMVIRAMSDTASHDANVTFDEFILEAGKRSAETLIQFLKELI